jgi:D-alanine-D-alanine ligase-like ATP-grasp enzyme/tetratricopeptide (TPR) repeat protein
MVTTGAVPQLGKPMKTVRMTCPAPLPALLIRVLPEIVRILNAWLTGKSFEGLPGALEKVIVDMARFAPQGQNMRLLLDAAQRLDVPILPIAGRTTQFGWGSRARWLDSSITDRTPAISSRFARDKRVANRFLAANGVPVPRQMDAVSAEAAVAAAEHLGFPVAMKPSNLDGGVGVTSGIKDEAALRTAYDLARSHSPQVIVESHIEGEDVRIGVVNGEVAWATSRQPAGVTGDGNSTVQQLIDEANRDARRGVRHWSLMSPVTINDEARELLKEQGISLTDVPNKGRFVRLRSAANISSGGVPRNVLGEVHPDNRDLVKRVCRLMRLDIAGVDLIIPDVTRSWREVGGAVCEVNAQPQFTVEALDLPFNVIGGLFDGDGRIPIIVMLGGEDVVPVPLLLEAFRNEGLRLGLVSAGGASVDGCALVTEQGGAFAGVQAVLVDPDVDCLIALLNDESWLATGAPVDRFDLLYVNEGASARQLGMLKPLQTVGTRKLAEAQLDTPAGLQALAQEARALLDWHDARPLEVEKVASAAMSASPSVRRAPATPGSIGLCMIAKNEAGIIRESLDSVRLLVDFVLVVDTGSTDGTQDVVRAWLAENKMAGEVIERPWKDFASNRTQALALLRRHHDIDYALILDADDVLVMGPDFDAETFKAGLTADVYDVEIHFGALRFPRPQLLRNAKGFGYRGVLHEFVEVPADCTARQSLGGLHVQAYSRGSRSQNRNKYEEDIALLEDALKTERDPGLRSRYLFYLAQSLQDARHYGRALIAYAERASIEFWPDEMYVATYRAACLQERLGHTAGEVEQAYLRAIALSPRRFEAYHGLCRFLRLKGRYNDALAIGRQGLKTGKADHAGLFVDSRIASYGLMEEAAIAAGLASLHKECAGYCEAILVRQGLPDQVESRVRALLERAREGRVEEADPSVIPRLGAAPSLMRVPVRKAG